MTASAAPFTPPFCPRPDCRYHTCAQGWRFKKLGFYRRQAYPPCIQRYLCAHCRRSFSTQTFSTTYWLRHPEWLLEVAARALCCSGVRQIARALHASPHAVLGQLGRIGRHCLLFQHRHRPQGPLAEPVVLDGFESFEYSQYHPFHLLLLVGSPSHFFYPFTDAELRRKGRMTVAQRLRRTRLEQRYGRPHPKALERETAQALRLLPGRPATLTLHSDDHPAYPRAFRHLPERTILHHVTPGAARRTSRNPLFPVNLLDLLIRHSSAHHKRETIAFCKRRQAAAYHLALLQVWRNFVKSFSERKRDATPAMRLGLRDRPLTLEEIFAERLFPSRVVLPRRLQTYYWGRTPTRRIPNGRPHTLTYAA